MFDINDLDFGNESVGTQNQEKDETTKGQEDITDIHPDNTGVTDLDKKQEQSPVENTTNETNDISSTGERLEEGTIVEVEDKSYSVDANGNLVDVSGNIFKEAKDVKDFLDQYNTDETDDTDKLDISVIQEALGVDITDEKGNKVEFTNDAEGVKSYVNKVLELKTDEIQNATLNSFYQRNPIVKDFVDYITVNNGDYRGFGNIPDRSGLQVSESDIEQQKAIIRVAFQEFNKRGDVESYIKYLEDSKTLFDVAKEELTAIQENDRAVKEEITRKAQDEREEEIKRANAYWNSVHKTISNKVIAGYKLPDSTIIEKNGQKITVTPNDFFNYINAVNKKTGLTAYQEDCGKMTDEEVLNQELLEAWLRFTGGSYKDLVDMAVKENEAKKLILRAKSAKQTKSTVKVTKPTGKVNINDILL